MWGCFVQENYGPQIVRERNFIFALDFSFKGGNPLVAKNHHDTNFLQQIEHTFMLVTLSSTRETQGRKLQVKVWDPGITCGEILKLHLEDKVIPEGVGNDTPTFDDGGDPRGSCLSRCGISIIFESC